VHPSTVSPPRTRTPPDLKWLLNEYAALTGSLERVVLRTSWLEDAVRDTEMKLAAQRQLLAVLQATRCDLRQRLEGIGGALSLAYPDVAPQSAGVVYSLGKFGPRGAFQEFVIRALQQAAPGKLTTPALLSMLQQRFGYDFESREDRQNVKDSLKACLRRLRDQHGVVESSPNRRDPGWRWKSAPTMDELRAQAARAEQARDCPDPLGDEVAGQRVGGRDR
jgi:hypothetical protein